MTKTTIDEYYNNNSKMFRDAGLITAFGRPGSGKTLAIQKFVNTIVSRTGAEVTIIDGKGGIDWDIYKDVVSVHENLEEVRDVFKELAESVRYQLQSGVRENKLIVVDEAQELFDKHGATKTEFALKEEINKHLTYVSKRARSTGVRVILISQKATFDSIPSHLAANAGIRIAFRLDTKIQAEAALGDIEGISPLDIGYDERGLAVVASDFGSRELVQF